MRGALAVSVAVEGGGSRIVASTVGLRQWLSRVAPAKARGSVGIAIVTDRRMQRLNLQFRQKNAVTDVLSFPNFAEAGLPPAGFWGDIAIAAGVAARQARAEGHSLAVQLRVLALHGLLHLLGYDHEVDKGLMGRVEERLRRRGG
ncbi:MAG: rRNA maturation RNase YbeY, partial [Vicinamibacterales bacterium]